MGEGVGGGEEMSAENKKCSKLEEEGVAEGKGTGKGIVISEQY